MPLRKPFIWLGKKLHWIGPGFITGAADDDPSGVATYSIAGAQFGYNLNWLALFLTPMMFVVQEMSARIGLCSGTGLAGVIKHYYSRKLLLFTVTLLIVANIINIGADLGIMAASLQMLFGLPFSLWLLIITLVIIGLEIFIPYKKYARYLKWMGLSLLVYAVTAFIVKQDWKEVFLYTLIPHIQLDSIYLMTAVGFIGTTISPYLFFWQASEEVEEEIVLGRIKDFRERENIRPRDIKQMRRDTLLGMIFSNCVAFFIVLTTAGTLHAHGIFEISSPQQAALALRPLAGDFTYALFALGIIGIGLQAVPILSGGLAYACAETFGFKEGLSKTFAQARKFYGVIALAIIAGALLNLIGINPIKALYYAAIINGIISVPLIFIIIKLAGDKRIVGKHTSSRGLNIVSWITFGFILTATLLMLLQLFRGSF